MKKLIIYILVICTFFACEKAQQKTKEEATQSKEEFLEKNKLNIPKKGKLQELNAIQKKLVQDWIEFNAINQSMKLINSSSRFAIVEDLAQLATNIEEVDEEEFPEELDAMQIRSRFLVLRTKALKLQDDAGYDGVTNDDIAAEIVQMNRVFNAICFQIQKVSTLNIDPEEILGNSFGKDSTKVKKPMKEVFKSAINEKPKPKKVLQQQIQNQNN